MKKVFSIIFSLVVVLAIIFGAYQLGANSNKSTKAEQSKMSTQSTSTRKKDSSISSTSSAITNAETNDNYDPNKTATGVAVDSQMISKVTNDLKSAGLPADMWAPSDIKSIITQASQQGVSPVEFAKQNFH